MSDAVPNGSQQDLVGTAAEGPNRARHRMGAPPRHDGARPAGAVSEEAGARTTGDEAGARTTGEGGGPGPGGDGPAPVPRRTVDEVFAPLIELAVVAVRGVSAASVSLIDPDGGGARSLRSSSPAAGAADEAQFRSGAGPCLTATLHGVEARTDIHAGTIPWAAGPVETFRSVWSLPLRVAGRPGAALNLYAASGLPWDCRGEPAARLLARHAAEVMADAADLAVSAHTNVTLRRAIESRTVIGQAQGILMARQRIDADEAFDILRRASQRTNRKLRDVAADIVRGATGSLPRTRPR